jgi:hypothetical protein
MVLRKVVVLKLPGCKLDRFLGYRTTALFIHLIVRLTARLKPLPNRALQIVRSRASSFRCEYTLLSLSASSSLLRFPPRLLVTSIPPFIFPSVTCRRKQFLRRMWPIQLAVRLLVSCRIFLCSLNQSNTSSFLTWSIQLIFSILLQHHIIPFQVLTLYVIDNTSKETGHQVVLDYLFLKFLARRLSETIEEN